MEKKEKVSLLRNRKKGPRCGLLKSALAIFIGILIAFGDILLPEILFSNEEKGLIGRQYTVSILSSDSVQAVVRDASFTLEDYAVITEMTQSGSLYYSEPSDTQLSMREASNASGEILKALLPDIFTGDVRQTCTLTSAILASGIQSSEEDYDYRQSFWYVDIAYQDDGGEITVSSKINAINGKAWTISALFPMDSLCARQVADAILAAWDIENEDLFYSEMSSTGAQASYFPLNTQIEDETDDPDDTFFAVYLSDDEVLIHQADDFYKRLSTAVLTLDHLGDFVENMYENYMSYLGLADSVEAEVFHGQVRYFDDTWYGEALEECRELIMEPADTEIDEAIPEDESTVHMDSKDVNRVVCMDSSLFETALDLIDLVENFNDLDISYRAIDESTGLSVVADLFLVCDEEFLLNISLGMEES